MPNIYSPPLRSTTYILLDQTHDTVSTTAFVAQLAELHTSEIRGVVSSILMEALGVAFFATGLCCVLKKKLTHS